MKIPSEKAFTLIDSHCSMAFGFSGGCALVLSHFSIKVHYFLVFIGIGLISVLNGEGGVAVEEKHPAL